MDYQFRCPSCADEVRRPLSAQHVPVLLEQGAHLRHLDDVAGTPLTLAEIAVFTRKLADPGALERELNQLISGDATS